MSRFEVFCLFWNTPTHLSSRSTNQMSPIVFLLLFTFICRPFRITFGKIIALFINNSYRSPRWFHRMISPGNSVKIQVSGVTDGTYTGISACFRCVEKNFDETSLRPYTNISSNTNSQSNPMQNLLQNNPDLLRHLLLLRKYFIPCFYTENKSFFGLKCYRLISERTIFGVISGIVEYFCV